MSIGPNEIDFVVRVQHEERLRQLTAEIAKEERAIVELEAAMKQAGATQEQVLQVAASTYGVNIRRLTKELDDLKLTMQQVAAQSQAMGTAMGRAMGGAGGAGGGGFGRGLMQLGYIADDLQYGFSAIVNNIGPFVAGLGAGAGVAGAAQIAAVALSVLSRHVGDLRDVLEGAWLGVPAEQLAKLRQNAEQAKEAFDKMMEMRPKAEEAARKALIDTIQERDPEQMMTDVRGAILRDRGGLNDRETPSDKMRAAGRAMLKGMNPFGDKSMQEHLAEARGEILKEKTEAETTRIMGDLGKHGPAGDRARQDMRRLIQEDYERARKENRPPNFAPGLLGDIERMDPKEMKQQEEWERQGRLNNANYENQKRVEAIEEKKRKERIKTQEEVDRRIKKAEDEQKHKLEERLKAERNAAQQRKELKRQDLQDRIEAKQEELEKTKRGMTADEIRRAEDKFFGVRKPEQSQVMGMKQFSDRMLTQGLSQGDTKKIDLATKQLEELKAMRKDLKDLNRLK